MGRLRSCEGYIHRSTLDALHCSWLLGPYLTFLTFALSLSLTRFCRLWLHSCHCIRCGAGRSSIGRRLRNGRRFGTTLYFGRNMTGAVLCTCGRFLTILNSVLSPQSTTKWLDVCFPCPFTKEQYRSRRTERFHLIGQIIGYYVWYVVHIVCRPDFYISSLAT